MKSIIKFIFLSTITCCVIGCENTFEPTLETELSDFNFITGDTTLVLNGSSQDTIVLKWEKSIAENATLVFYKVQFSDQNDDFEDPTHEMLPGKLGSNAYVSITDSLLNIIAEKSAIRQLSTGKIYWRVIASNGVNSNKILGGSRHIEVTRPDGFAAFPSKLYLTGSASPGGNDLSKAVMVKALKKKSDNTLDSAFFNIVLPLKQGEFKLVSALQGRIRTFGIDNNGNIVEIFEEDDFINECPANGVYHISLNFNTKKAEYASVSEVNLVVIRNNLPDNIITEMNYSGEYTWEADFVSRLSDGTNLPAGAMYKFRFSGSTVIGNNPFTAYWGSPSETSSPPNASTPESYFHVMRVNNDLRNYYRFATAVSGTSSGKNMRAILVMNPVDENHYHTCTIKE